MKQFLAVFRFTYLEAVRKKSFRVTTILLLVVILAACLVPKLFGDTPSETDNAAYLPGEGETIYYLDETGAIPGGAETLKACGYAVEILQKADEADARARVADDGSAALVAVNGGERPTITVTVKNFMSGLSSETVSTLLSGAWSAARLAEAGMDAAAIQSTLAPLACETKSAGALNPVGYTLGLVLSMVMFFAVFFYGYGVANSIATEKTSRVMETLIVSAKPTSILTGKCAAMGAVGLTQMGVLGAFGMLCAHFLIPQGVTIGGVPLTLEGLTALNGLYLVLFFLVGYAMYSMLGAVCGASVSRIEDVNVAMMPLSLLSMISFYLGYFTFIAGRTGGVLETLARYLPFAAPFGMPARLLTGAATPAQAALSLAIMLVTLIALSAFSARLYAAGVMYYGKRLTLRDMLKMK